MKFELVPTDEPHNYPGRNRPPPLQGECGHFVKYTGFQRYYNGSFNCARTLYHCTICGPGKIEHV